MQNSSHLPDHFSDLIDHSLPYKHGLAVALHDLFMNGISVCSPKHADKAAGT